MRQRKPHTRPKSRRNTVKKQYSLPPSVVDRVYDFAKAHEDQFQHNKRLNESAALIHIIGVFFDSQSQKVDEPVIQPA